MLVGALLSAVVIALASLFALPASAYTQKDRDEQTRYAKETINLSYTQFIARKADFQNSGCRRDDYENNGFPYPGCRKPSPYNSFNWSDDGCSGREHDVAMRGISNLYRNLFNQPCQLHDFGYRNFAKGLTLGRSESMRYTVDTRFRDEMLRLCETSYAGWKATAQRLGCRANAEVVYKMVRRVGGNWDTPPETPLAPLDPPTQPGGGGNGGGGAGDGGGTGGGQTGGGGTGGGQTGAGDLQSRVYYVMNTSETPPDGVWFRDNPGISGPRLNGYGVYMNDRVELRCYGWGEALGPYKNRLWYMSANLTRPSAPGRANVGWLNAHYVNDNKVANEVAPGVPPC